MGEVLEAGSSRTPETAIVSYDRSAVLGWLMGPVTHTVNNQLGAIMGWVDLMLANPSLQPFREQLEQMADSCSHVARLFQNLTVIRNALARKPATVDASRTVEAILTVFATVHQGKQIRLKSDLCRDVTLCSRSVEFTQAAFHFIKAGFEAVAEASIEKRTLDCSFGPDEGGVTLRLGSDGCFVGVAPVAPVESPLEGAADFWILERLCGERDWWRVGENGREQLLFWAAE